MRLAFFIAIRYLFAKKSRNVINYISFISGIIIAFVTTAMILVLSTFNGIDDLVKGLYSSLDPAVTVGPSQGAYLSKDTVNHFGDANEVSEVLEGQVVLQSGKQQLVATLYGVDANFLKITKLSESLNRGSAEEFLTGKYRGIILGAGLHYHLQRAYEFPSLNPVVVLNIPQGSSLRGNGFSSFNKTGFTELATFNVTAEFDLNYAFISRQDFIDIFRLDANSVSFFAMNTPANKSVSTLKESLVAQLGPNYQVKTREEKNAILFQTSQSEKWVSFSILFFIVIVAAFNIVASLCILVMEKKKDLFILKVIGMHEAQISKVFFIQSLLINLLGLILGMILGVGLVLLQQHVGLLKLQGSVVEYYPVALNPTDLILICVTIFSIAIVTFWPVQRLVRRII